MLKEIVIKHNYINIPIANGADKYLVRFCCEGRTVREFEAELAAGKPDFWAYADVSGFKGKTVRITAVKFTSDGYVSEGFADTVNAAVEPVSSGDAAVRSTDIGNAAVEHASGGNAAGGDELDSILESDTIIDAGRIYSEKLRPQFHFSCKRGWLNDPNGLLYYKGEYHLFYQHNPFGWSWGNMHWGHAVSSDLLHWEELGEALHPDETGTMFSGSGVVDSNNTSGFQTGEEKPLVLIYTAAGGTPLSMGRPFTQCISYSNDRARTWTKYDGNPVLQHIAGTNRDPRVIWHETSGKWIMALYLEKNEYALFASKNLKEWERICDVRIPGCTECPDFFELPVDGGRQNRKAVFWGANGSYIIGGFDGRTFTAESDIMHSNYGNSSYAAQTWNIASEDEYCEGESHCTEENGCMGDSCCTDENVCTRDRGMSRLVQIAWCRQDLPGMPFNQFMTFPCELTLRKTEEGIALFTYPISEIEILHKAKHEWKNIILHDGSKRIENDKINGSLFDIFALIDPGTAEEVRIDIRGVDIVYRPAEHTLNCLGKTAHIKPEGGKISLRVLVDRASVEIFGNGGQVYMPMGVIPEDGNNSLCLSAAGGEAVLDLFAVYELKGIWGEV